MCCVLFKKTKERKSMTTHELLKILDSTFPDVEMDIHDWEEGIVKVIFKVDKEEEENE